MELWQDLLEWSQLPSDGAWTPGATCLGWWYGNAVDGDGKWFDRVGSRPGTLIGNATLGTTGLTVPNRDGYVQFASALSNVKTWAFWFKFSSYRQYDTIIGSEASSLGYDMRQSGSVYLSAATYGKLPFSGFDWHHYAWVYNGTNQIKAYYDGSLVETVVAPANWNVTGTRFGSLSATYPRYITGQATDFLAYSSELDAAGISDIYTNSLGRPV